MNALRHVDLTKVFLVDIETVPCEDCHSKLSTERQALWDKFCGKRHQREITDGKSTGELFSNAGLYAEFGKIVCISVGFFRMLPDETLEFRVKSFADDDECVILKGFADLLDRHKPFGDLRSRFPGASPDGYFLCAHNGREFDYAYLGRRMVICGISLPLMLDIAGYKPWDLPHLLDTMDMWKFGDNKGYTSLALLAGAFNIPSPKDDIDGSQVGEVYWKEKNLARIVTYCQKDVETTARVLLHLSGQRELWSSVQLTHMPWPDVKMQVA